MLQVNGVVANISLHEKMTFRVLCSEIPKRFQSTLKTVQKLVALVNLQLHVVSDTAI